MADTVPVDPSLLLTDEQLRALVAASSWTFAKSMPDAPHSYVVRAEGMGNEDFVRFATTIIHRGYVAKFGRTPFHYLDLDGFQYWAGAVGFPMRRTRILNRCPKAA
jgi:hypothetical protein